MKRKLTINEIFVKRINALMDMHMLNGRLQDRAEVLSKLCDKTTQACRRWLSGQIVPGYESMILIAAEYGVTVSYLIGELDDISLTSDGFFGKSITIDISFSMFNGEFMPGDKAVCHPIDRMMSNGEIYLLKQRDEQMFAKLYLEDGVLTVQKSNDEEPEIYTNKNIVKLYLSTVVCIVECIIRPKRIN